MKKLGIKIIGILMIAIILLQGSIVFAATQKDLNKVNSEIEEKKKEKEEIAKEKSETVKQVEELSTQISDYQSQIDELDGKIAEMNTKIAESQKQLDKAQEDYSKQEDLLNKRLVATYEAGETSYLDFLLSSDSITDLISNYFLVTEVATNDAELLDKIQKQKDEIEKAKNTLEESKKELATSKASKQSVATQLESTKKQKNEQVNKLTAEEKEIQSHIDELRSASAKIEKEIQAAQKRYEEQIKALDNYNGGGNGRLQRPVNSGNITATMYYSSGSYHGALDYGVPEGTPVYAAADGVVITTANLTYSYGTHVVIQHAGGLQTWYAHGTRGSISVSPGQTVSRGQQIMRSGNTGKSFGAHLHFEVRVAPYNYDTCRVDPRKYF